MIIGLYSIYDRVSGVYNEPFTAVNKQTAIRRFNYLMDNAKMVADDCELFYVGKFDTNTGDIIFTDSGDVEFICHYEVKAYE